MPPDRLEVADVFREHGGKYCENNGVPLDQIRILRDLTACRTAALGGHVKECDRCGHQEFFYKSCGNRHCPKCQAAARGRWLEERAADLLQTRYFHVVFTLPHGLGPVALQNKRQVYGVLFRAASETLLEIARDPKHLGAQIGFLAVLHTWGQRLDLHPHLHCVVPGGGLSPDGTAWVSSPKDFFLHVKVLSRVFRGKFLDYLTRAFQKGQLVLEGQLKGLRDPQRWKTHLKSIKKRDWVVYAKRPFGGPRQVLKYLARYTHRVAISNQRLVSMEDGRVSFRWKDYADERRKKTMTLDASEFIRRFLLHVLPSGLQRIRHYGFLANKVRRRKVEICRNLLVQRERPHEVLEDPQPFDDVEPTEKSGSEYPICPACKKGRLLFVGDLEPDPSARHPVFHTQRIDSS